MRYLVLNDPAGGMAYLTTDSPASGYFRVPVLQITGGDVDGDFGPVDLIGDPRKGIPLMAAASVVAAWANSPDRSDDERAAARRFLRQWPEGPQVEGGR